MNNKQNRRSIKKTYREQLQKPLDRKLQPIRHFVSLWRTNQISTKRREDLRPKNDVQ